MYANTSESFPNSYCLICILRPSLSWNHHFEIFFFSVCFKSPSMDWQIPPANFYSRDRFSGCFSMVISSGMISRCFPNDFETILEDNYDCLFFLVFVLPRNILFMTFTFMSRSYFNSYSLCIILAVVVNIWLPWHLKNQFPPPIEGKGHLKEFVQV